LKAHSRMPQKILCQFDKIIIKTSTKVLICSFIQV
jgi:hypothetical protein